MSTLQNSAPFYHMKPLLCASGSASASASSLSWTPLALSLSRDIYKSSLRKQQTKDIVGHVGSPKIRRRSRTLTLTPTPVQCMVPAVERMVAAVGYVLPFFNGLQYGRYFFMQYPKAGVVLEPLLPLFEAYQSIPYASFVAFFGLYLGVVRNPSFSRYVRFNAMQAVVVDVLLALPMIFQRILSPRGGPIFNMFILAYNALFLCIVFGFLYALASCVLGTTPRIPFVADAADAQL